MSVTAEGVIVILKYKRIYPPLSALNRTIDFRDCTEPTLGEPPFQFLIIGHCVRNDGSFCKISNVVIRKP